MLQREVDGGRDDVHLLDVQLGDELVVVSQVGRDSNGLPGPIVVGWVTRLRIYLNLENFNMNKILIPIIRRLKP